MDRLTRAGRAAQGADQGPGPAAAADVTPLTGDLGKADLAVLERCADPGRCWPPGRPELTALIVKASHGQQGADRAQQWRAAAAAAVELYADHPAIALDGPGRRGRHRGPAAAGHPGRARRSRRGTAKPPTGTPIPVGLARCLPGVAEVGGPVLVAGMGRPGRFPNGAAFKSYTGLAPRASETGNTDRKGQPMSKAGSSLLRTTLIRAADNARQQDPQLARIYYTQMVERGAEHLKALCVVAGALAERAWTVMNRRMPYVDLRHRRHTGHPGTGETDHRAELHRPRRGPPPAPQQQDAKPETGSGPDRRAGEGPSASRTRRHDTSHGHLKGAWTNEATFPADDPAREPPHRSTPKAAGSGCAHPSGRPPGLPDKRLPRAGRGSRVKGGRRPSRSDAQHP